MAFAEGRPLDPLLLHLFEHVGAVTPEGGGEIPVADGASGQIRTVRSCCLGILPAANQSLAAREKLSMAGHPANPAIQI